MTKKKAKHPARARAATDTHAARAMCEADVMSLQGVTMVSEGMQNGKPCIVVGLEADDKSLRTKIKRSYGGVPVCVEISGKITAL